MAGDISESTMMNDLARRFLPDEKRNRFVLIIGKAPPTSQQAIKTAPPIVCTVFFYLIEERERKKT